MGAEFTLAQNEATKRYQRKQKAFNILVKPEMHQYYKGMAEKAGLSMRQFILRSMDEKIERDGLNVGQ